LPGDFRVCGGESSGWYWPDTRWDVDVDENDTCGLEAAELVADTAAGADFGAAATPFMEKGIALGFGIAVPVQAALFLEVETGTAAAEGLRAVGMLAVDTGRALGLGVEAALGLAADALELVLEVLLTVELTTFELCLDGSVIVKVPVDLVSGLLAKDETCGMLAGLVSLLLRPSLLFVALMAFANSTTLASTSVRSPRCCVRLSNACRNSNKSSSLSSAAASASSRANREGSDSAAVRADTTRSSTSKMAGLTIEANTSASGPSLPLSWKLPSTSPISEDESSPLTTDELIVVPESASPTPTIPPQSFDRLLPPRTDLSYEGGSPTADRDVVFEVSACEWPAEEVRRTVLKSHPLSTGDGLERPWHLLLSSLLSIENRESLESFELCMLLLPVGALLSHPRPILGVRSRDGV